MTEISTLWVSLSDSLVLERLLLRIYKYIYNNKIYDMNKMIANNNQNVNIF